MITKNMLIGEAVAKNPEVVEVFLKYGLHCVGCQVSPYETIEQGVQAHGMSEETLKEMIDEANAVIEATPKKELESLVFSEKAVEKVREIMEKEGKPGYGLRFSVTKGGCAGNSYMMDFEQTPKESDAVFETHGLKVFYDKGLDTELKGISVDYRESLQDSGFTIQNPNATATCGCGKSFS